MYVGCFWCHPKGYIDKKLHVGLYHDQEMARNLTKFQPLPQVCIESGVGYPCLGALVFIMPTCGGWIYLSRGTTLRGLVAQL